MVINKSKYKLKGHGTFVIREGWLSKALYYIKEDNLIFREKRAADQFGVGSNMASAIKYWLKACDLIVESAKEGVKLSNLAKILMECDPYFEDVFTLWILHCNLVMSKELATSWYLFFNKCEANEYSREDIYVQLSRELKEYIMGEEFSEKSLNDDVLAITNMYARVRSNEGDPEDNMVSPFVALGLVKETNHCYSKAQPDLAILNNKVVLYVLIKQLKGDRDISIDELETGINSIGKILNLSRVTINQYLDHLSTQKYITINRTAGLDTVYKNVNISALEVVKEYYRNIVE